MKCKITFSAMTKLFLLCMTVLIAAMANSLTLQCTLIGLIMIVGLLCGRFEYSLIGAGVYGLMLGVTRFCEIGKLGMFDTIVLAWMSLMLQVYPCGMMGGIVMRTTKMGEILYALYRLRISRKIVIPFAIMMRYIPTIREDWRFIRDAMKMRGVSPTPMGFFKQPGLTLECIYTPLLLAASKAADELTIAAVTRGIENPVLRTSWIKSRFGVADLMIGISFVLLLMGCFI